MARHVHADLMIEAANDTSIEWQFNYGDGWGDCDCINNPSWDTGSEYRKKPREFQEGHWYPVVGNNNIGSTRIYNGNGRFSTCTGNAPYRDASEFSWIGESLGKIKFG